MKRRDRDGNAPFGAITFAANAKKAINVLTGIALGILSDGRVEDKEILFLDTWMRENEEFLDDWPMTVIARRVEDILADGYISKDECADFYSVLLDLVGGAPEETGAAGGVATRLALDPEETIHFEGRCFCLTGKFLFGPRSRCEHFTSLRGGEICQNVVKKLDYLVIGTLASRDWAHSSHGRKIEKALAYKEAGIPITIVPEEVWARFV